MGDESEKQTGTKLECVALYDYKATKSDELSFSCGDVIQIINQDFPGWWTGQLNGVTGLIPSNYVQIISEDDDGEGREDAQAIPNSPKPAQKKQMFAEATHDYQAKYGDELSFSAGSVIYIG